MSAPTGLLVKTGYGQAELERHGGQIPGAAFVADTVVRGRVMDSGVVGFSEGGAVSRPAVNPRRFRDILAALQPRPARRGRRPRRRRVHLRPGRSRVARSARADSQVRLDGNRARRRRQRRAATPRRSAPRVRVVGVVGRDSAGDRLLGALPARADVQRRGPRQRLRDAGQDAHPRRRRALGQAAGRADRPRRRGARPRRRPCGRSRPRSPRRFAGRMRSSCPTTAAASPRQRSGVGRSPRRASSARPSCSSTRATAWPASPA